MVPLFVQKLLIRSGVARCLPRARRLSAGGEAYLHYYADRVLGAPLDEFLDPAYSPAAHGPDVIDLNAAAPESAPGAFRFAHPAFRQAGAWGAAWGLPALREAVAAAEARKGRRADPGHEVFVTHGATGAVAATLDAFVNPGDRVVAFDPTSPMLTLGARSRRARLRLVPTRPGAAGEVAYEPDALSRAMRGAKLVLLADPANPTGATLTHAQLEHLAWAANRSDVLIALDETFDPLRYEGKPSALPSWPVAANRTLRVGSLAPYGLAPARVGWVTGPRHLVKAVALAGLLNAPPVSPAGQQLALRELTKEDELFGPTLEEFRARRRFTLERLRALKLPAAAPAGGTFVWVDVTSTGLDGRAFAAKLLREAGVLVGPGVAFGPSGKGFVRVSFATDDGRLREGLARLATFRNGPPPARPLAPISEGREASFSRA